MPFFPTSRWMRSSSSRTRARTTPSRSAQSYGAVVVETEQGGKAASQQVGLAHVEGDILVCIDADTVIDVDVVEKFVAELDAGADATCANMLPIPQQRVLGREPPLRLRTRPLLVALSQAQVGGSWSSPGCAYALRTDTVRCIGFPGELITCGMDRIGASTGPDTRRRSATRPSRIPMTRRRSPFTKQMRRWASGFFQNFQAHRDLVFRSPASFLVVGSLLLDLLTLPITYTFVALWALNDASSLHWLVPSIAIHALVTTFIASRTITWKQAITGFPCYWVANWWNKAIYFWTFIREWILGRHYGSWTGRQGRATEISPMSRRRKAVFAIVTLAVALAGCRARTASE